ncbi:MAG: hypothetical protein U1B78_02655, partial [Dehalococcoidia bacterium]|nr:hypothetical protein [Dehalococcoidia bacterium]
AMLLDDFVPEYDFSERHETVVPAPKEIVRRALEEWRPSESLLWRLLLRLRGLGSPRGTMREWAESMGFLLLAEDEHEIVYGQVGRFWELRERSALVSPRRLEEFRAVSDPRDGVALMNVLVEPIAPDRTRLFTETRVRALGAHARWHFRLYWLLIRPFSGLLRRSMLNGIRKRALAASRAG